MDTDSKIALTIVLSVAIIVSGIVYGYQASCQFYTDMAKAGYEERCLPGTSQKVWVKNTTTLEVK